MTKGLGLNRRKGLRGNRRSYFVELFRGRQKTAINIPHGTAEATAPIIISASRATEIPAFYADWFMHRVGIGHVKWINPFNGQPGYIVETVKMNDQRFGVEPKERISKRKA